MSDTRRRILVILATIAVLAIAAVPAWRMARRLRALDGLTASGTKLSRDPVSIRDALARAPGWVNAPQPTRQALAARPIAMLFWCDTDPASLAALATAETWRQAYGRYGVQVIGVHEPDFAFAGDDAVAARAAQRAGAEFPIALDPAGELRGELGAGDELPALVVTDSSGAEVWRAAGLGRITGADAILRDQVARLHPETRFPAGSTRASLPRADAGPGPRTIYLGSARVLEGPLAGAAIGRAQPFTAQFRFQVEGRVFVPYPVGWWTPTADGITASRAGAANFVALRCEGEAIYVVASPPEGGSARLWILRDEAWLPAAALGADARRDADGASYVEVTEPRLYEIALGAGNHVIKLSPAERGLTLHALVIVPKASGAAGP